MTTQSTLYVTYIVASPERIWKALTHSDFTREYFFGRTIESDWQVGSPVRYFQPDGTLDVSGIIQEADYPRRLAYTWRVEWIPELRDLPECIVSFDLASAGEVTRLAMTEAHPTPIEEKLLEGGRKGWPIILSGLKSLLETGRGLPGDVLGLTGLG